MSSRVIVAVCFVTVANLAQACLWDWDTLQMERRRFPGTLEIITGKFVRHSPAYYEWRIRDRMKRMESEADIPHLAGDLAVAYSKLGRHAEAISLLEKALEANPDRYETLSNLGTIHMLAGDLKTGKAYIDRAIVINPDAHFGRERYQSMLADYFLTTRKTPHPAAESFNVIHPKGHYVGFAEFVLSKNGASSDEETKAELAKAQKGILGMMHFADYDSPLLLEALGDLLIAWPTYEEDALQLAARAYYRIAQVSSDEETRKQFKEAAKNMVWGQYDYIKFRGDDKPRAVQRDEIEKLSTDLDHELDEAQAFVATIAADERRWIDERIDVDQAFAAKYYDSLDSTIDAANKQLSREWRDVRGNPYTEAVLRGWLILGSMLAALVGSIWGRIAYLRHRRKKLFTFESQESHSTGPT